MYLNPITVIAREDKPGRIRLEVSERRFRKSTHHYMFGEHENPQSDIDNTAKIDKGHQKTEPRLRLAYIPLYPDEAPTIPAQAIEILFPSNGETSFVSS
jgi:hypothetical protein